MVELKEGGKRGRRQGRREGRKVRDITTSDKKEGREG